MKNTFSTIIGLSAFSLVAMGQISKANAGSLTFTGTGTNSTTSNSLGASVLFDDAFSPGNLAITLSNTGPGASAPSDVLTSVFWDYDGMALSSLSLFSATAPTVIGSNAGTNVNLKTLNEWKLPNTGDGTSALPGITQNYGLGTAGLGIFQGGGGQQFNYGIISGYDSPNPAVSGGTFVKDSATFVLAGLPSAFDISKIGNIRFQYGTALNEPSLAGIKQTSAQPPAPVVEQPPAPVVEQPPAPVVEQPPAPVVEQPPAPVVEQPPAPVVEQPPAPPETPKENVVSVPEPTTMAGLGLVAASLGIFRRKSNKKA